MSRSLRRLALVSAVAAGALALSACTAGQPAPSGSTDGSAAAHTSLTVGLVLEPTNLDIRHTAGAALEQLFIDNVYEGLVTRNEENVIEPRLARDYTVSPDGLTYTFTLNEGVAFHSGTPVTAETVIASFEEARTDETVKDGAAVFGGVASLAATDEKTVEIVLTEPNQNFLFALTGPAGLVFETDDDTDLQTAANGTGPFVLASWSQGSNVVLERNDAYWGAPAGVGEVVLQYIPDFTAGVNAARDGSLDVLTAVDPNLASQLESAFTLNRGRTTDKATLAFNNTREPLTDVRVREALRLAVDHEGLVSAANQGITLFGPIPEIDPGYEDLSALAPYDPERAKELLAEAGYADGLRLTLTIPSFYGNTVPQILASDYAAVGVTLEVDQVEFATWLADVYGKKDYDLSFVLHVEPRDFGNFANPDYYFGYDNPEVQALYAQAMAEIDPDASADLLAQAARIVSGDHAADWLYNTVVITAVREGVSGFPVDSVNSRLRLENVTVSD